MMAEDREILREIWDGRIPVSFSLASEEITGEQPDSIYLLVPRQSYFPLAMEKAQRLLLQSVDSSSAGEMWLEFEGLPLKWHYPIGVLFDLYATGASLPWNITVHFKDFPEEDVLRWPSKDAVESHFISMVKEADALKHRSQVINSMQKKDHKQLWLGLQNDKFEQFWSVNKKLMEGIGDETFRNIPFRVYQLDKPWAQKPFRPICETGAVMTFRDLLQAALSDSFDPESISKRRILVQGIEVPLDTPAQWMSEHLSYPDNFLHICVVNNE